MRALKPVQAGRMKTHGFTIGYEVFGDIEAPAVLIAPTWQIAPSLHWKMQVPYLARHRCVITYDSPGIGMGERTTDPRAYEFQRVADYGIALLEHLGIGRANVIGHSRGGMHGLLMAASYPERVERLILSSTADTNRASGADPGFWQKRKRYQDEEKFNAHYWRENYREWLEYFLGLVCSEPHSSKIYDDLFGWALETTPEILIASVDQSIIPGLAYTEALERIQCPVLMIHSRDDALLDASFAYERAALRSDWHYFEWEGACHALIARHPVRFNLQVADFFGIPQPRQHSSWQTARSRKTRRVLFVSSPIGLGHIQRDLAIARQLRTLIPDLQIDWLAQPPVTDVLTRHGETIHPLSAQLACESDHIDQWAGEHELHVFYSYRDMDEIMIANFMVFLEAVRQTPYDLWIGDEAWEVDHYLHENPELKTAPYVFLSDFIGWLPMDRSENSREAFLTADYNAEMIEHRERYRRIRDRSIFIGEFDDIVAESFGPGLPMINDWAREYFQATGYITPFDPIAYADTKTLRSRLGYDPDQPLILAAVGGTHAGRHLLAKTIDSWSLLQEALPEARCVIVTGPRIDPAELPEAVNLDVRHYIHDLYEHIAAADLVITQGGLGTTMECVVTRRPFLYFPLKNHCEQVYHVTHRLQRHMAGRQMDYHNTAAEIMADAIVAVLSSDTAAYRLPDPSAAGRAAGMIAELL